MKTILMTFRRDDEHLALPGDFPDLDFHVVWSAEEMAAALPGARILILNNRICTPELGHIVRGNGGDIGWIQFLSSGTERGEAMGYPKGVPVTNAAGTKGQVVSEHAMALLLASMRRVPDMGEAKRRREWARLEITPRVQGLEGKTLVVVGLGSIGREVARKAKCFDTHVIGVSRNAQPEGPIDEVFPRERLTEALARADMVVLTVPAAADTIRMISRPQLRSMKPSAVLVNVARGEILDEAALIEAIQKKWIAGAALDVAEEEPLPESSQLWALPEVLISPHIGGAGSSGYPRFCELFADNLARFQAGRPLRNVVAGPDAPVTAVRMDIG